MKDGDTCPQCGGVLEEGIAPGKVVCLSCRFEGQLSNEEIETDVKNWKENMVERVYAFIAWDDEDNEKVVFLCKTKELANKLMENYKKAGWEHTNVQEMEIYESLEGAEGWTI